jgi:hypothetical protein
MKLAIVAVVSFCSICVMAGSAAAEDPAPPKELIIGGGGSKPPQRVERCVEVQIGNEKSGFNCLNDELRQKVDRVNPQANIPPLDAKSQDIKVGVVNVPGVQQQYGSNFGKSVIPFRPAPPVYVSPLARH